MASTGPASRTRSKVGHGDVSNTSGWPQLVRVAVPSFVADHTTGMMKLKSRKHAMRVEHQLQQAHARVAENIHGMEFVFIQKFAFKTVVTHWDVRLPHAEEMYDVLYETDWDTYEACTVRVGMLRGDIVRSLPCHDSDSMRFILGSVVTKEVHELAPPGVFESMLYDVQMGRISLETAIRSAVDIHQKRRQKWLDWVYESSEAYEPPSEEEEDEDMDLYVHHTVYLDGTSADAEMMRRALKADM